jgi:hypothetical protein
VLGQGTSPPPFSYCPEIKKFTKGYMTESQTKNQEISFFDADEYQRVKGIVTRKVDQLDELRLKVKEINESMKNILINDSQLSEAEEEARSSKLAVAKRKKEVGDSPEMKNLRLKRQEIKEELSDLEDSLNNQLLNLYQITGVKEFEMPDGTVREFAIKSKVKAVKK